MSGNTSAVTTAKIADGAVTTPKIAANAITSAEIQDGTVQAADLAFDAIGVPGYELFEESTTFGSPMEAGSFFTLGRVCPDGKMALGGGGDSSQFAVVIHASRPHGNGRGWTVDFHNTSDRSTSSVPTSSDPRSVPVEVSHSGDQTTLDAIRFSSEPVARLFGDVWRA